MVTEYQYKSLQTELHKAAKIIDEQQTEIERLTDAMKYTGAELGKAREEIERLRNALREVVRLSNVSTDDYALVVFLPALLKSGEIAQNALKEREVSDE